MFNQSSLSVSTRTAGHEGDSSVPPAYRARLHDLFAQIDREFELLYNENTFLQEKLDSIFDKDGLLQPGDKSMEQDGMESSASKAKPKGMQKVKTSHKLKAQTSKIVSSFKGATVSCSVTKAFHGHKDGVWDVEVGRSGQPLVGTASADHTARLWSVESGRCLLQYMGHSGSVNSIRFHPTKDIVLTSSGDHTAHVWQAVVAWENQAGNSSCEDLAGGEREDSDEVASACLRTPVKELTTHTSTVSAADWMHNGDQIITASWDRTACLFDVETGELVQSLAGHDAELTHVSSHPQHCMVVTCSKDTTFRLWDFREPIHSVSVFQGHTETVTSAILTKEDKVVSGSDDSSVKVWDLRNMRSPFATIATDSAVNRLAVSASGVIAIPHDNRQVRLFDLNGHRIVRLPRTNRQGHRRMVTAVAWQDDSNASCNLFSCGFDRVLLGWSVHPTSKEA